MSSNDGPAGAGESNGGFDAALCGGKSVSLVMETFNIQHSTPNIELELDGKAIQQALVNLIDNAIKHSPKGETVTVGLEARDAKAEIPNAQNAESAQTLNSQLSTLNLFVKDHARDSGRGTRKIFERFYRRGRVCAGRRRGWGSG